MFTWKNRCKLYRHFELNSGIPIQYYMWRKIKFEDGLFGCLFVCCNWRLYILFCFTRRCKETWKKMINLSTLVSSVLSKLVDWLLIASRSYKTSRYQQKEHSPHDFYLVLSSLSWKVGVDLHRMTILIYIQSSPLFIVMYITWWWLYWLQ